MKQWSTKDLQVLQAPSDTTPGDAILTFTDRYSVFDYGVMPDRIPGKGRASCAMAVHSFGLLERAGVSTHFVEQVADDAIRIRFLHRDPVVPARTGAARLIPLQVVYRQALRPESSVHRRLAAGRLDPALVPPLRDPATGLLGEVMVEFTSKFEETDRFLTAREAERVGGVSARDLAGLAALARWVCAAIDRRCAEVGLTLVDGKAEFGFDAGRTPLLVDHAGTPDENRFYLDDVPVCKELLRSLHPGLREVVQRSVAEGLPRERWPRPDPLPAALVEATAEVYAALAALWTGGPADAPGAAWTGTAGTGTAGTGAAGTGAAAVDRLRAATARFEKAGTAARHEYRSYR